MNNINVGEMQELEANAHESWLDGESLPPNINKSASKTANVKEVPGRCLNK